jgi:hypothetical protein
MIKSSGRYFLMAAVVVLVVAAAYFYYRPSVDHAIQESLQQIMQTTNTPSVVYDPIPTSTIQQISALSKKAAFQIYVPASLPAGYVIQIGDPGITSGGVIGYSIQASTGEGIAVLEALASTSQLVTGAEMKSSNWKLVQDVSANGISGTLGFLNFDMSSTSNKANLDFVKKGVEINMRAPIGPISTSTLFKIAASM